MLGIGEDSAKKKDDGGLDKKSAAWLWRPGRYMISKLYPKSLVAHFCCLGMWQALVSNAFRLC